MGIIIGSARIGENGKITKGKAGDQKQTSLSNDKTGEVSMQNFYVHSKGWYIIRFKNADYANKCAELMKTACNNRSIGYNQNDRYGINKYGINSKTKINCDCSSLVRQCVKEASGKDPGDFNTSSEWKVLNNTGLFENKISYVNQSLTPIYDGDILVTKTKGHTVVVVSGNPRSKTPQSSSNDADMQAAAYDKTQFIKDVQAAIGAKVDGIAGKETLSKTITVSRVKNNKHSVVKPLQKYLNLLGFNCGSVDGIAGNKFDNAVKEYQKSKKCVVDGEITAQKNTWKYLLGLK